METRAAAWAVSAVFVALLATATLLLTTRWHCELYWNFLLFRSAPLQSVTSAQQLQLDPPSRPVVQRVTWSTGRPFAKALRRAALPVVLVDTAVTTWPAAAWTPQLMQMKLADESRELTGIYRNRANRYFGPFWDPGRPAGRHLLVPPDSAGAVGNTASRQVRPNPYEQNVTMNTADFFAALDEPLDGRATHLYLTHELSVLSPSRALEREADLSELLRINAKAASVNLWAGQAGVVAPCHYDGHHNMYVQLHGRKRFWLWPPTAWPLLRPFPFLHPSHAQAQTNVSNALLGPETGAAASAAERRAAEAARMVELGPGELLYLPPLWFHQVEAVTPSISLNVWTQTDAAATTDKLMALELPLPSDTVGSPQVPTRSNRRRVGWFARALRIFIQKIIAKEAEERRRWLAEEIEAEKTVQQGEWGSLGNRLPKLRLSDLELDTSSAGGTVAAVTSHREVLRSHYKARFGLGLSPWGDHAWELAGARSAVRDACDADKRWVENSISLDEVGLTQKQETWATEAVTLLLEVPRAERGLWLGNLLEAWMAVVAAPPTDLATTSFTDSRDGQVAKEMQAAAPSVSAEGVLHAAALFDVLCDC